MSALLACLLLARPAAAAPRLVVLLVVDQLRADAVDRTPGLRRGLARLRREGYRFRQARHHHIPAETAPGHATLATGLPPARHGIVGYGWWDRARRGPVLAVDDSLYGRGPEQLLAYGVGDALKAARPAARVVCLSQKDRAAILLCGKRPDAAIWLDRDAGGFASSPYYGGLPEWARAAGPATPLDRESARSAASDRLVLDLAGRAVQALGLGRGAAPDLLALSLSAVDHAGHRGGPQSGEAFDRLRDLDEALGGFLDRLDRSQMEYALVLASDHGASPSPESAEGRARRALRVPVDRLAAELENALELRFPSGAGAGGWVLAAYSPYVYLSRQRAAEAGVALAAVEREAAAALSALPGVAGAYRTSEVEEGRLPPEPLGGILRDSIHPERSGELVFVLRGGSEIDYGDGAAWNHGQPTDDDLRVPLLFFGRGIPAGSSDRPVSATEIAPAIARLLGVAFAPQADAAPLPLPWLP